MYTVFTGKLSLIENSFEHAKRRYEEEYKDPKYLKFDEVWSILKKNHFKFSDLSILQKFLYQYFQDDTVITPNGKIYYVIENDKENNIDPLKLTPIPNTNDFTFIIITEEYTNAVDLLEVTDIE